jgi:PhzF family phenazine biosynthesis protein
MIKASAGERYWQVDVFAHSPGGGNPLGVVLGAQHWSTERMQAFARWTNLVETTFVLSPSDPAASYHLRIFTPEREIAFAGHPTVGSAHVVLEQSGIDQPLALVQQCAAGLLPIRINGSGAAREIAVRSPSARVLEQHPNPTPALTELLAGRTLGAMGCALVEGGRRWWLAELASEASVRSWQPDHALIAALARADQCLGLCVFAQAADATGEFQLVVRAFPAGVGIIEDPASGAANGLIGTWLALARPHGPLARGYVVSQGREMGKDASLRIDFDEDAAVWVGGRSHTVLEGALNWPWPDHDASAS